MLKVVLFYQMYVIYVLFKDIFNKSKIKSLYKSSSKMLC